MISSYFVWKGIRFERTGETVMRYYRYGKKETDQAVEAEEKETHALPGKFGELIIEEDTVYEIDEECLRCKKKKK